MLVWMDVAKPKLSKNVPLTRRLLLRETRALEWLIGGLLTWSCLTAGDALGARVHLRLRSTLTVQVASGLDGAMATGRVADSRGVGVVGAPVALRFAAGGGLRSAKAQAVRTAGDGRFSALLVWDTAEPVLGTVHVQAEYAGDAAHGEARAETTADLGKPQPTVEWSSPTRRWAWTQEAFSGTVAVRVGDQAMAGLPVQVWIDEKPVLALVTDASGSAQLSLPMTTAGRPGAHRLRATVTESDAHNGGEAVDQFEVFASTLVDLEVAPGSDQSRCSPEDWCLEGKARMVGPVRPEPLEAAAVVLYADKQIIGNLVTDADGRFAAVLRTEALQPYGVRGAVRLVAQVAAGRPWVDDGWSEVLTITLPGPAPWREWSAAGALAGLLGLLAWRAIRRKRLRAVQSLRQQATEAGLPTDSLVLSDRRGEPSFRLAGKVLHGESSALTAATLTLTRGDEALDVPCAAGNFCVDSVPEGLWALDLHCEAHEPLHLTLDFPHDGRFDGCTLLPASCRAVVRGTLSAALRRSSGRGVDWGKETPRLVEPRWTKQLRRGHVEVRAAIGMIERALYGRRTNVDSVRAVKDAVTRVDEAQK